MLFFCLLVNASEIDSWNGEVSFILHNSWESDQQTMVFLLFGAAMVFFYCRPPGLAVMPKLTVMQPGRHLDGGL